MHDNPQRRHHSIVFNLYATKKLCTANLGDAHASEEQEQVDQHLFKHVSTVQQQMLQTSMSNCSDSCLTKPNNCHKTL